MIDRGGQLIHIDVFVNMTQNRAKNLYEEDFKPRLIEYLKDYQLIFHEELPSQVA